MHGIIVEGTAHEWMCYQTFSGMLYSTLSHPIGSSSLNMYAHQHINHIQKLISRINILIKQNLYTLRYPIHWFPSTDLFGWMF